MDLLFSPLRAELGRPPRCRGVRMGVLGSRPREQVRLGASSAELVQCPGGCVHCSGRPPGAHVLTLLLGQHEPRVRASLASPWVA